MAEMKWAKEQGAVGIFLRGMEGNLTLDNPQLHPIYALAERLDLTLCIHTGSGSRHLMQLFDVERNHTFAHNRVLPVVNVKAQLESLPLLADRSDYGGTTPPDSDRLHGQEQRRDAME